MWHTLHLSHLLLVLECLHLVAIPLPHDVQFFLEDASDVSIASITDLLLFLNRFFSWLILIVILHDILDLGSFARTIVHSFIDVKLWHILSIVWHVVVSLHFFSLMRLCLPFSVLYIDQTNDDG